MMEDKIELVRLTREEQVAEWQSEFRSRSYHSDEFFRKCWDRNTEGSMITLLAYCNGKLAGAANLKFQSDYPHFQNNGIPEVNALDVFPEYRRKGIANRMFDEFEKIAAERSARIGVGVGLYRSYGNAQRLYVKRGFVPDGNGVIYDHKEVQPGSQVRMDDDLVLYLVKELR